MGIAATRAAIEGRLLSQWTITTPGDPDADPPIPDVSTCRTPIALENIDGWITLPDGSIGLTKPPTASSWIRCVIREGAGMQKDLNPSPRVRFVGVVKVQIFVPRGTGTDGAKDLADLIVPIFQRQVFSGIHCRAAELQELGEDEQWWAYSVTVPYYRDEISS